jgi:hypothetical protein
MTESEDQAHSAVREAQARAWLRTTFRQRLDWLEQAKRFAARALAAADRRRQRDSRGGDEPQG